MEWLATIIHWDETGGRLVIMDDQERLYLSHKLETINPETVTAEIATLANTTLERVHYVDQKNYQRGYRRGQCIMRFIVLALDDTPPF